MLRSQCAVCAPCITEAAASCVCAPPPAGRLSVVSRLQVVILASLLESELTISYDAACLGRVLTQSHAHHASIPAPPVLRAPLNSLHRVRVRPFCRRCLGYISRPQVLTKFNSETVRNLKGLAAAVYAAASKPFLHFQFDEPGTMAVIETAQSRRMEAEVLGAHDVAAWCSRDVDPRGDSAMMGCITAFSPLRSK